MRSLWLMKISGFALSVLLAGCGQKESSNPVSFRADLVPLKVYMTDYIIVDGGEKLVRIEGSAQLIVPVSSYDPRREGDCFVYESLPCPVVDEVTARIDKQILIHNDRGWFETLPTNSDKFNKLRAEAKKNMIEIAGNDKHKQIAKATTKDALRTFYGKFGYDCKIYGWKDEVRATK